MERNFILEKIKNKLIISSQAAKNEPLYNEHAMNALIETIVMLGDIDCLRLAGARDIKNTKDKFKDKVTVIGITKPDVIPDNYKELVYITPAIKDAKTVIEAGADIIAFDSTKRNKSAKEIADFIHLNNKLAMGDIATLEDARYAAEIGCDIISTTLSGYTKETETMPDVPDFELLENARRNFNIPVILEGKIWSKEDVEKAFKAGAHSVVIGSAVTRPHNIIKRFKEGLIK
ncbi:MAG: putative N-acetylmannosamine-6-phosphate 2-epimerase [bacterium]|nr:putative N-acetylmannosamine-6-phosphate 2-epimerase [bacterium]